VPQIARVLQIQEKEFLEAYRGHMYGVQRELRMWQEKADEEAARALRDAKVQRLEEESAWFRAEALRLNKYTTAMKNDLTALREQIDSTESDRAWLEKQLKAAKRENALLRAELAVAAQASDIVSGSAGVAGASELLQALRSGEDSSDVEIARLQEQVDTLQAQLRQVEHTASQQQQRPQAQQLQELFLSCVQSVREATSEGSSVVSDVSFSALTPPERRAIIARLLEDDFVLSALHSLVFANGTAPIGSAKVPPPSGDARGALTAAHHAMEGPAGDGAAERHSAKLPALGGGGGAVSVTSQSTRFQPSHSRGGLTPTGGPREDVHGLAPTPPGGLIGGGLSRPGR